MSLIVLASPHSPFCLVGRRWHRQNMPRQRVFEQSSTWQICSMIFHYLTQVQVVHMFRVVHVPDVAVAVPEMSAPTCIPKPDM